MRVRKAIIPAAGLGTRFLPATKAQPKEMLPIIDTPAIQYIVEEAIESGIESIMIVTGKHKRSIEDHFDKSFELESYLEERGKMEQLKVVQRISNMVDIHYIRQKEPLGLGHAILCAEHFVENEPFAVLLGDDILVSSPPCLRRMMDVYEQAQTPVIALQQVPDDEVDRYGIISPAAMNTFDRCANRLWQIQGLVEKPGRDQAPSNLAVIGRYILEPSIFPLLEKAVPGKGGEIQLTDALNAISRNQLILGLEFEGKRYDVGDKLGYIQATIEFALKRKDLKDDVMMYLQSLRHDIAG
ncbi:UTP--glucose-1-phosphate uridylyltransferase GalU [Polycladomyces sp. WAk]|uniref:UTP--glucose-1-phosphate uridylyltransferase n=1 Tax=Polycladomyces zharkentensis TaxID=2807616 RepID=A0ABS2WII1_9BACL|nr:UTP--glucose-1-phosphate uridylyltransferase GalU [Polycladomyces sp. WAk]MBN2909326.1 UTP--glucose-1-phosphate uridylyltransferase GalU [Polycladomyces sp. WAk]